MGTNYYFETVPKGPCPTCGRREETAQLHIGKSSLGWVFSLCVYPELNINTLEDWQRVWREGGQIRDEYGEHTPVSEMVEVITQRSHAQGLNIHENGLTRKLEPGEPTWQTTTETDFS